MLASCGGGDGGTETLDDAAGPTIPSEIALELAQRSDEVAQKLDSGDPCGAEDDATKLREDVTKAINARQIPTEYLEELQGIANELEEAVITHCDQQQPPPPPPPPTTDEEGDGDD